MDRSFYGRCHPENIWALCGLAGCLKFKLSHQNEHNQQHEHNHQNLDYTQIKQEYDEILEKIDNIRNKSGDNSIHVNVSCMCVKKSELE